MRISKRTVGRILVLVVLGLTLCVLLQHSVVKAKSPVTRPVRVVGQLTILNVDRHVGPWAGLDQGVSSQSGAYTNIATFTSLHPLKGFGISFAANGDQMFWESDSGTITATGGTGRFEDISGECKTTASEPVLVDGPSGTKSMVVAYSGEGFFTYWTYREFQQLRKGPLFKAAPFVSDGAAIPISMVLVAIAVIPRLYLWIRCLLMLERSTQAISRLLDATKGDGQDYMTQLKAAEMFMKILGLDSKHKV